MQNQIQREQQIKQLEAQVEKAFADYCQLKYYIHSIVIHDGGAESGHYYTFVKKDNYWWRFNDFNVTMVDYATVVQESFGGY